MCNLLYSRGYLGCGGGTVAREEEIVAKMKDSPCKAVSNMPNPARLLLNTNFHSVKCALKDKIHQTLSFSMFLSKDMGTADDQQDAFLKSDKFIKLLIMVQTGCDLQDYSNKSI